MKIELKLIYDTDIKTLDIIPDINHSLINSNKNTVLHNKKTKKEIGNISNIKSVTGYDEKKFDEIVLRFLYD